MSKKYRKMLNDINAPYLQSLMKLIETQSKITLVKWCLEYAENHLLHIYEKHYSNDFRPRKSIESGKEWLAGNIKFPEIKKIILNCHQAAREAEDNPIAQAVARACGQVTSTIHVPTHSLGLALYGALAIAYDIVGIDVKWNIILSVASKECNKMEEALKKISIENEPNPVKINWKCR
ncbi:MAG: hypothetical protein FWG98_13920 [Candidatus Cloacimonetes bacterium]|nr:hypothetical protein [Candidatus Cloacimonadota bacterium]